MIYKSKKVLICISLLAFSAACKKSIEQETPKNVSACLIATQTIKQLAKANQSLIDSEKVSIDGESFVVSTTAKSVYSYDEQGRILTEYTTYADGKADSVLYSYTSTAVSIRTVTLAATGKTAQTKEVSLNNNGFAEHGPGTYEATYDQDGYLTSLKYLFGIAKVVNGNVIDKPFGGDDATQTYTYQYEYDLNKAGLPAIQTFYGQESRNLLVRYTIENDRYRSMYGSAYVGTYGYAFDNKGRVTRQILRGKQGEIIGFLFEQDKVIVKDFSYTCP